MRPFYLGKPNSEGVFVIDLKRDQFVDDGVSLYKFEPVKDDEKKAHFSLYNASGVYKEISDLKGAENWKSFVLPVCDCDHYPEKLIDGIKTKTKGEAELRPSGNWKVVKKAKIEYTESDEPEWYKALKKTSPSTDTPTPPLEEEIEPIEEESVVTATEPDTATRPLTQLPQSSAPPSIGTRTGLPPIFDKPSRPEILPPPPSLPPPPPPPPTQPPRPVGKKSKAPIIAAVLAICIISVSFLARPSVETLFNKGKEQFEAKNFTEAVTYFSKAIKRNSDNAEFYAWRGRAFYEIKKHEAAIADFKEAARAAPKVAEYHSRLGEVYSDTAVKNYDGAVTAYTQAIKLESDNANHYFGRAVAHSGNKSYSTAIDDFTQAIRLDSRDARYWNSRGGDYRNMGDYDKAYADHSEAIRLNASDAKYHNNRGVAQVLRKKYVDAIPDFSEAIRLAPDNARYYNNRGDAYVLNKDVALAAADYRMALKFDPSNEKYRRNLEKTEQRLSEQEEPTDTRDGQKYRAVKIGGKIWLAQNMNYRPQGGNSWCYEDNSSNCEKYGRLYDWNTAKTACLSGWHLPSRKEWKDLVTAAGAFSTSGKKLKVAPPEWNGTDDYKFSAQPGGFRNEDGSFSAIGTDGSWWTATENNSRNAYLQYMGYDYGNVLEVEYDKSNGISVRCVMDVR
jgi:uncharacterized protein (TIGR02145 family)